MGMMGAATPVEYLLVGGGGGAGGVVNGSLGRGGGGGAGRLVEGSTFLYAGSHPVVIGSGGAGGPEGGDGESGDASSFGDIATADGGGGGGGGGRNGLAGGSGGGAGNTTSGPRLGGDASAGPGFGYAGGDSNGLDSAGGGGADGPGVSGDLGEAVGGPGRVSAITGSPVTYARGGGLVPNKPAAPNTGNGGDYYFGDGRFGGPGDSGVLIVRYIGPQRWSGGDVTTAGAYTVHTFTSDGTFAPL